MCGTAASASGVACRQVRSLQQFTLSVVRGCYMGRLARLSSAVPGPQQKVAPDRRRRHKKRPGDRQKNIDRFMMEIPRGTVAAHFVTTCPAVHRERFANTQANFQSHLFLPLQAVLDLSVLDLEVNVKVVHRFKSFSAEVFRGRSPWHAPPSPSKSSFSVPLAETNVRPAHWQAQGSD